MARLAHQVGEGGAVFSPGGEQAAAQGVAGEALIETRIASGLLDQPGDRLVGQALTGDPPGLGDGAEQRAFSAGGGRGGPIEVGGSATVGEPRLERRGRTKTRLGRIGPDRDTLAPGHAGRSSSGRW